MTGSHGCTLGMTGSHGSHSNTGQGRERLQLPCRAELMAPVHSEALGSYSLRSDDAIR